MFTENFLYLKAWAASKSAASSPVQSRRNSVEESHASHKSAPKNKKHDTTMGSIGASRPVMGNVRL